MLCSGFLESAGKTDIMTKLDNKGKRDYSTVGSLVLHGLMPDAKGVMPEEHGENTIWKKIQKHCRITSMKRQQG